MNEPSLFDSIPPEPDPKNDATPAATGDGVKGEHSQPKSTKPRRRARMRETSLAAYRNLGPESRTQAARILALIIQAGARGVTDEEGEATLGIKPQSYTPRRGELEEAGLVRYSGMKRPTSSGCGAMVWVAVKAGGTNPTPPTPPTNRPAKPPRMPPLPSQAAARAVGGAA
jgi:hypothetical protein